MRTDLLQHLSRRYAPRDIEPKWQRYWHERRIFSVANEDSSRPKFYVLDMFPYPSGTGLHVGHPRGYVASDIVARFQRMRGYQVLHPMGWDSFGLPTERQAERELIHPAEVTERNIARFRAQLKLLGLSYDWDREFATSDPRFFKWTQWIFLKLYERGLAYVAEVPVNWCSALNTVLANEEVSEGVYVETGDPVERRLMRQWILRITAYADRLLEDLGSLDWPESLKEMQRKWIGRSEGARIIFRVAESEDSFEVFTTRPDTLFGCTFCVLSPEHPLAVKLAAKNENGVLADYLVQATQKSERERISQSGLKKGAYAGANAINPVTGEQVPIWVSDFVLASYGTGAIFGCPAHDERDYAFARQFDLPIIEVVTGGCIEEGAYTGDGEHIHSQFLNGLKTAEAKERAIEWLERHGGGKREVQFALRD